MPRKITDRRGGGVAQPPPHYRTCGPRELLDRFGLSGYADTYAGDLSGGQRRLTEIMRALMTEPTMLLLDEPMAGVHPRLARQIGAQLLGLSAEGMTIVMVGTRTGHHGRVL